MRALPECMKLQAINTTMKPSLPYSLCLTAARFARFPDVVDLFDGTSYRRLLLVQGTPLLVEVRQEGSPRRALLHIRLSGAFARCREARDALHNVLNRSLGAFADIRPFYKALESDPLLAGCQRRFEGLRLAGWPDAWEALVTTVLCQQVNLHFAYTLRTRIVSDYGTGVPIAGATYHSFPSPCQLAGASLADLRRLQLSQSKSETLLRLAAAFTDGGLSQAELERLSDEAAIERLVQIKGIGTWTAETVLLRGLGRLDAFPAGDLGVVKYLAQGLLNRVERASEKEMRAYAERWRPFRGLALVYAYAELNRRKSA